MVDLNGDRERSCVELQDKWGSDGGAESSRELGKRGHTEVGQCGEEGIKLGVPARYSLVGYLWAAYDVHYNQANRMG